MTAIRDVSLGAQPLPLLPQCVYDDIYLAIRKLRQAAGGLVRTCMVIDLDVHQGNGYERDKLHFGDQDTYLVDVYNGWIYPRDETAKKVRCCNKGSLS